MMERGISSRSIGDDGNILSSQSLKKVLSMSDDEEKVPNLLQDQMARTEDHGLAHSLQA